MDRSDLHSYFTEAFCHLLALELHARTGLSLWACVEPGLGGVHALVRLPDGRYLDVCGARTSAEVRTDWPHAVMRRVSPAYFADWRRHDEIFGRADARLVRTTAARLLRQLDRAAA